jgi:manganese/zinc/iron transport system substrate-binding protein
MLNSGPLPHARLTVACLALSAAVFVGCTPSSEGLTSGSGPLRAVCTTGMVADMVTRIGGDRVTVDQLMGEGVDPHLFKATPDVIQRLTKADVVFYSGLHLEGRMTEVFEEMTDRAPTVALATEIPADRLIDVGGAHDPHVWFDVALWSRTAEAVRKFFAKVDPAHAEEYERRAKEYQQELAALDAECRRRLSAIPESARVLVTAHDAFHYFGRTYGVEVKAIQGVSTETEAGVKEINDLVSFIVERKIKAVFVESSVSERNIAALVEGCKAKGHDVRIGGELFSDSMGKPGTEEGTYPGMVRHNVELIVNALQ